VHYLGVIIEPGKTSLSPTFQQAAIDYLQLDYRYTSWPTPPDGLSTRVTGLRAPTVRGANVTIPHKEAVMPLLDELDATSVRVGAVNTVVNDGGRLSGHNTDVQGFLRALEKEAGFSAADAHTVVAGAGGSARAVVVALLGAGAASVTLLARNAERAQQLADDLSPHSDGKEIQVAVPGSPGVPEAMERASLLVNCTPLGTAGTAQAGESPVPAGLIHPDMLVYDLVYNPAATPLLRAAETRGARTLGGLPMLVYQGAASFELWTGRDAPEAVMMEAAQAALREGGTQ
jgi:shikimate dehydrogenase